MDRRSKGQAGRKGLDDGLGGRQTLHFWTPKYA